MSNGTTRLQVLLVEDEPDDLKQYIRDLPKVFIEHKVEADIHPCVSFEEAFARTSNPLHRYDLIISDTYRGPTKNRDAQVIRMVDSYRGTRFCPLVVYSSSVKPVDLKETAFIVWADKGRSGDIERAIKQLLDTNIPQLARKLHDELESTAASYLWKFLDENWATIQETGMSKAEILERLIRRRASIQLDRLHPGYDAIQEISNVTAADYYIIPPISAHYRLGHVLQHKGNRQIYILLTPHCHLEVQKGQKRPRADHVLVVPAFSFKDVMQKAYTKKLEDGTLQFQSPWGTNTNKIPEKLRRHIQSPPDIGSPEGRHWFLPGFMNIPDSYCDFMQVQSIPFDSIVSDFIPLAVIDTPFAEALQSCFTSFYSSVGLPNLNPLHFMHLTKGETSTNDKRT